MSGHSEAVDLKMVLQSLLAIAIVLMGIGFTDYMFGDEIKRNGLFGFGFLVLSGLVAGRLCTIVGLPSLTGYLLAGLFAGPSISNIVTDEQVEQLRLVNGLALALIAMQAGSEFTMDMLKKNLRGLIHATWAHVLFIGVGMTMIFLLLRSHIEFLQDFNWTETTAIGLLFAVVAISKSPGAVVAILSETKLKNRLSEHALGMVVILDVLVLVIFALAMAFTKSTLSSHSEFSLSSLGPLISEILASVAAGTFFGLLIAAYFKFVRSNPILFIVAISYGVTALCSYLHYDTLLVFVIAGFVVTNLSKQSERMVYTIESLSSIVMIAFFATAGASLHLQDLMGVWKLVMILFLGRVILTWISEKTAHHLAESPLDLKKYGFTPFVSQAGLSIGLSMIIYENIPEVGPHIATLAISVIALNEVFGPILFKWGLKKSEAFKETETQPEGATT